MQAAEKSMFLGLFYDECFDQLIQPIVTLSEVCHRRECSALNVEDSIKCAL